jgi:hypothetical protein
VSAPILLFVLLVLSFALAIVTAVVLAVHVLRRAPGSFAKRAAMAVVVPWGALDTWRRGHRTLPALLAIAVLLYAVLRAVAWATVGKA